MEKLLLNNEEYLCIEIPENAYDFESRRNNEIIYGLKDCINPLTGSEKSVIVNLPDMKWGLIIREHEIIGTVKNILINPELQKKLKINSSNELIKALNLQKIICKTIYSKPIVKDIGQMIGKYAPRKKLFFQKFNFWVDQQRKYQQAPYDLFLVRINKMRS